MHTKLIVRYAIREIMGIIVMGAAMFWSAGRVDWWPAWAALAVMLAWIIATAVVILRYNPDLLAERLGPRKGAKPWDTAIMSILALRSWRDISWPGWTSVTAGPAAFLW